MAKKIPIVRICNRSWVYETIADDAKTVDVQRVTLKVYMRDGTVWEKAVEGWLDEETLHDVSLFSFPWSRKASYGRTAGYQADLVINEWRHKDVSIKTGDGTEALYPWSQVVKIEEKFEPLIITIEARK